ncbi:MAG: type 4a pilus biogenesis protein PilO [Burkholderiaceae bacterium]
MATKSSMNVDFSSMQEKLLRQFRGLDPRDPSMWPAFPRYCAFAAVAVLVVVGLWFAWLDSSQNDLETEKATELKLRDDYKIKLAKAVNLDVLKKQREQVLQYVTQLEKQLPSKAEMDALLSDINQAGLGRSLQFELFRPGQVVVRDYYAELPISLRVTGGYNDIGAFASDIANLSRIVTLNNIQVTPRSDSTLIMDATAKTFRYLDPAEVAAQRKVAKPKGASK